jgi:hypothetical protein
MNGARRLVPKGAARTGQERGRPRPQQRASMAAVALAFENVMEWPLVAVG